MVFAYLGNIRSRNRPSVICSSLTPCCLPRQIILPPPRCSGVIHCRWVLSECAYSPFVDHLPPVCFPDAVGVTGQTLPLVCTYLLCPPSTLSVLPVRRHPLCVPTSCVLPRHCRCYRPDATPRVYLPPVSSLDTVGVTGQTLPLVCTYLLCPPSTLSVLPVRRHSSCVCVFPPSLIHLRWIPLRDATGLETHARTLRRTNSDGPSSRPSSQGELPDRSPTSSLPSLHSVYITSLPIRRPGPLIQYSLSASCSFNKPSLYFTRLSDCVLACGFES
ncbi:uncharacterized protein LOC108165682 [Poecilia reticulata]|uniref:uncharacterized protein LOC108165682 n=1 Tax=Poecilia reticulata TaxID=8081 RepID=UPI0007EBCEA4|nr:PREDICTED: uncharacterized protein LOC108165682 [Poecilia reticulata]